MTDMNEKLRALAEEWRTKSDAHDRNTGPGLLASSWLRECAGDLDDLLAPETERCTALDGMPRCSAPPVPGTSTCWAHGGDLIAARQAVAPPASPEAPAPDLEALLAICCEAYATGRQADGEALAADLLSALTRALSEARRGCEVCRAASTLTAKTVPQGYAAGWHDAIRTLASTTRGDAR